MEKMSTSLSVKGIDFINLKKKKNFTQRKVWDSTKSLQDCGTSLVNINKYLKKKLLQVYTNCFIPLISGKSSQHI